MGVCLSRHHRIRRSSDTTMANTIKMTNPIKNIVSKRRKRYTKDGFNLDLAYITPRLIAMGYPADRFESVYRNHIDDVFKFLEQKHPNNYWIYNLCKERSYDTARFQKRVSTFAFDDHNPPKIEQIQPFCEAVDQWLSADPNNVAAVHCKAGKGRTGTMVCCYLLHSGEFRTADEALNFYGQKRAHDKKGVTIPSQRRYVHYYSALLTRRLHYRTNTIQIRALTLHPAPLVNGQCTLELCVTQADSDQKIMCGSHEVRKGDTGITISLDKCAPLAGDVKVELYQKPKMMRKDKLLHFWFNTFFVAQEVDAVRAEPCDDSSEMPTYKMCLDKWHLDDAHKDKQHKIFTADFKVELLVQQIPATSAWSRRVQAGATATPPAAATPSPAPSPAPSPPASTSSESSVDESGDETWDSGERYTHNGHPTTDQTMDTERYAQLYCSYSQSLLEMTDADKAEGKIPKVASDHTISDEAQVKARKYKLFSKKESQEEEERSPAASDAGYSRPRLSLGDVRASWREFSGKHFGTEHAKHKKKLPEHKLE